MFWHRFHVHPDDVGFIVGSKGKTINKLKHITRAHIQLYDAPTDTQIKNNPALRPYPFFYIQAHTPYAIDLTINMLIQIAKESENRRFGIFHHGATTKPRDKDKNSIVDSEKPFIIEFELDSDDDDDDDDDDSDSSDSSSDCMYPGMIV
jgi:hypothetical protein